MSRSSTSALLASAGSGAAAAFAVCALLRRRRERRLLDRAKGREAERAWLSTQLVTAEQDERRRLSLALHDGPLQSLSGIVLLHDAALRALREGRSADAEQALSTALERERQTIQTLRDLSFALEPVVLRDHGFEAAVTALADQLHAARGIDVCVDVSDGEALGEKAKVAVYQTLREALDQAVRRQPSRIDVTLSRDRDGAAVVSVVDDGVRERRERALEAIVERARVLQGRVTRATSPSGGTALTIDVPPYTAAI